jgi:hypothetical protein
VKWDSILVSHLCRAGSAPWYTIRFASGQSDRVSGGNSQDEVEDGRAQPDVALLASGVGLLLSAVDLGQVAGMEVEVVKTP